MARTRGHGRWELRPPSSRLSGGRQMLSQTTRYVVKFSFYGVNTSVPRARSYTSSSRRNCGPNGLLGPEQRVPYGRPVQPERLAGLRRRQPSRRKCGPATRPLSRQRSAVPVKSGPSQQTPTPNVYSTSRWANPADCFTSGSCRTAAMTMLRQPAMRPRRLK